ncbi:MAG: CaiB/BaiF CoA-transferase family protein [Dehalococcoidia bacterium]|nr:CaiB/BaiF CoA-transferase family protein [Dehalococcoidia bacterium]
MPQVALNGIRVLELSDGIAAPYCAKMFSDYGADVVRIDSPDHPSTSTVNADNAEQVALYLHLNANKKSVALDLESERGRGILRELALQCDAVVESMSPGVAEGLGIGYETLAARRPDIVMTSVTPFGQTGPYSGWGYTELTIFAMTGAMNREGLPNRYPLKYGGEIAQYFAGTTAAAATMSALTGSALSGIGDWVDISIMEVMSGHPHQVGRRGPFAYSGETDKRTDPRTSSAGGREPYAVGTFRCKDGYVSFLPLGSRMWPNISQMIGQPELQRDPRFLTSEDRSENRHELEEIFQTWLEAHTRMEIFDAAQRAGLPGGPVLHSHETVENEHFRSRGYFQDVIHPVYGHLWHTGLPIILRDMPRVLSSPAPEVGSNSREILAEFVGLSESEIRELEDSGVVRNG